MAFSNKDLRVGDFLVSDLDELYIYLGFYVGHPWSLYRRPDYGYLYVFCDSWSYIKTGLPYAGEVTNSARAVDENGAMLSQTAAYTILSRNIGRIKNEIDGNARYSKSYSKFSRLVGHIEIPDRATSLMYAFGLSRVGDKKPRGFKG